MSGPIRFGFQVDTSDTYGHVLRPVAKVAMRVGRESWQPYYMYVDSGADVSIVSGLVGVVLGFTRRSGDKLRRLSGIGGSLSFVMRRVAMRIGDYELQADLGWAQSDDVPLILGRKDVFDSFDVKIRQRDAITEFRWRD